MSEQIQEILPCAHCKNNARVRDVELEDAAGYVYCVECINCKARTGEWGHCKEAIAAWNRRAAPVAQWTTEPKEPGLYLCQDVIVVGNEIIKMDDTPCIKQIVLWSDGTLYLVNRGGGKYAVKNICGENRWWLKLNIPALPEEGKEKRNDEAK